MLVSVDDCLEHLCLSRVAASRVLVGLDDDVGRRRWCYEEPAIAICLLPHSDEIAVAQDRVLDRTYSKRTGV